MTLLPDFESELTRAARRHYRRRRLPSGAWLAIPASALAVMIVGLVLAFGGHDDGFDETPDTVARTPALTATPSATARPARKPLAARLDAALLALRPQPHPDAASCSRATARDLTRAPFGATRRPVFVCSIGFPTYRGRKLFDVQVLSNGCFVAERRERTGPGPVHIDGCGVR